MLAVLYPTASQRSQRPFAANARSGYTLLELMLALALLGALLTVAWSLMGTYRDAEQKGWQLSMRTQTVRAVHDWLQQDIDHITTSATTNSFASSPIFRADSPPNEQAFSGTSTGFTMTIQPSMAPLPFLERLMSDRGAASYDEVSLSGASADSLASSASVNPATATPPLWTDSAIQVEYRLTPVARNLDDRSSEASRLDDEMHYRLSRIARQTAASIMANSADDFTSRPADVPSAADRVRTAEDLYRQNDDDPTQATGPILEESTLHGLVNARFRYFDGRNWVDEWSSAKTTLPSAIALSFDLSRQFEPLLGTLPSGAEDEAVALDSMANEFAFADAALASEPVAEIDTGDERTLVEDESHQVHIVVLAGVVPNNTSASLASPAMEAGR